MNTPKVINKVTPTHTFDWYIKWIATVFILAGLVCRGDGLAHAFGHHAYL